METIFLILYLVPRTSVLGAVLFTECWAAWSPGMCVGDPLMTHELAGVYLGIAMWVRLWLRDPALRTLFPVRTMGA